MLRMLVYSNNQRIYLDKKCKLLVQGGLQGDRVSDMHSIGSHICEPLSRRSWSTDVPKQSFGVYKIFPFKDTLAPRGTSRGNGKSQSTRGRSNYFSIGREVPLCRIQEVVAPARGVTSIKFENPEIKKRCGDTVTALYCLSGRSNKGLQIEHESVPRMWHLLARSGLSE